MVSLPLDTGWRNISRKNPRGSQGHRRYNLAFLASMLNGGEAVFAPGFTGTAPSRGQRVVQMGGTLLQLPKLLASRNATEINGPLSSYGPISVTIGEANFGRVFKNLLSGNPSIVVRGRSGSENPLAALCDYLGVDTCERMVAKVLDNPVLVFECTAQDQTVIVHLAVGEDGLESVDRHRDGLRRLDGVPLPSEVRALTSKIIDAPHRPQAVLVETRVPGRPIAVRDMSADAVQKSIEQTLDLVVALAKSSRRIPEGPDHAYIREKIADLPARLETPFANDVAPAVQAVMRWPDREKMPASFVHGDFWLSNVLFDDAGKPAGLVDWEWSRPDGLPAFDALQLVFGTLAEQRRVPIASMLTQVWDASVREPWIDAMMDRICQRLGTDRDALIRTALVLWLGIIRRSAVDTSGISKSWFDQNVSAPAQSFAKSQNLS